MTLAGKFQSCLIGFSNDTNTRVNSSSGGLVTETYKFLLRNNLVDGVLMVVQDYPKFYTKIAYTIEDLRFMENSVYAPVDYARGLKEMEEGKTYAITGISCQMKMLAKYEKFIKYKFGLLCRGTYDQSSMKLFAHSMGINNVKKFNFRRNGWPGQIEIIDTYNKVFKFDKRPKISENIKLRSAQEGIFSKTTYLPKCINCQHSFSCEEADISFGDPWLKELEYNKEGFSLIFTRNDKGENLIREMIKHKKIDVFSPNIKNVISSLESKKTLRWEYLKRSIFKLRLGYLLPVIHFLDEYIYSLPIKETFRAMIHKYFRK